jgi:hypothetical protein
MVDCDSFYHTLFAFPARWNDLTFNGVLPKGTPVAQCLPVKRESWAGSYDTLSGEANERMIETRDGRVCAT